MEPLESRLALTLPWVGVGSQAYASEADNGENPNPMAATFHFGRDISDGPLVVSYEIVPVTEQASLADVSVDPGPYGQIYFPDCIPVVNLTVTPVDDTMPDPWEQFEIRILPSPEYQISASDVPLDIYPSDVRVESLLVERELPDDQWETVPAGEKLWDIDNYRWTAEVAPSLEGYVSAEFFIRPWSEWEADPTMNPHEWLALQGWQVFASSTTSNVAEGTPPVGVWAIVAQVNTGGGFLGAMQPQKRTVDIPRVNLRIFDGQSGPEIGYQVEDTTGAATVANLNDTDADGFIDNEDHSGGQGDGVIEIRTGDNKHGRDEVDLMKLIVERPFPYNGGNVVLTTPPNRVRLWGNSTKTESIDAAYDPETGIATWTNWVGLDKTIWVEIKSPSATVGDVQLTLTYKSAIPETVVTTGVWAFNTANMFGTVEWPDLAGTIWRTEMDAPLQAGIQPYGGTGKRGPILMPGTEVRQVIANVMATRFSVTPPDVATILPRVKFDITRQKELKTWRGTESDEGVDPTPYDSEDWPKLWEVGNDDDHNNDESAGVLPGGHLFATDDPRARDLAIPPGQYEEFAYYRNFQEFVRVRFDTHRPTGYAPDNALIPIIDGSQSSSKVPWHSRVSVIWVNIDQTWKRIPAGLQGDNMLGPEVVTIGNTP